MPSSAADPGLPYDSVAMTVIVAARIYIRLKTAKVRLEAHDWCILGAWADATAFDIVTMYGKTVGLPLWEYNSLIDLSKKQLMGLASIDMIFCKAMRQLKMARHVFSSVRFCISMCYEED